MSLPELNRYELQKHVQAEADHQFRYSKGRMILQGVTQFFTPIVIATFLEKGLDRLFTSHSHLDAEESLNNSQILASLSTGMIVMMLGYAADYLYGYKDRQLLNQIAKWDREQADHDNKDHLDTKGEEKEQKSDNKPIKTSMLQMAQGMAGYDLQTFCKLIYLLDSNQKTIPSDQTNKIMDVLNVSDKFLEIEYTNINNGSEFDIRTTHQHTFKLYAKTQLQNESDTNQKLKTELKQLNNNCSLLLPYYKGNLDDKDRSFPEEYGFLYFTQQQREIRGICYNPTNHQEVNFHLEKYFKKIVSEIVINSFSLNTATPISHRDSGPWVIMQIQAVLNKQIDLIDKPHRLVPETNLSSVRLSQFSFLISSSRNQYSAIAETKALSHSGH